MRKSMILPLLSLLAACASHPADSPQAQAAYQAYEGCLRSNATGVDDHSTDPEVEGVTLAGYCLQEFSRYQRLSGVDDSFNEHTATRIIIAQRRH